MPKNIKVNLTYDQYIRLYQIVEEKLTDLRNDFGWPADDRRVEVGKTSRLLDRLMTTAQN